MGCDNAHFWPKKLELYLSPYVCTFWDCEHNQNYSVELQSVTNTNILVQALESS